MVASTEPGGKILRADTSLGGADIEFEIALTGVHLDFGADDFVFL